VLQPGCELPNGLRPWIASLRDGNHDYIVSFLIGPDAPRTRRAEINQMLDSLHFSND
jgi:hypothetical protein